MVTGISSAGVSLASQSPLVDNLRQLRQSLEKSDLLNEDVDDALKKAVQVLENLDSANPMTVATSIMNLLHEVEKHGCSDQGMLSQISDAVYQIVSNQTNAVMGGVSSESSTSSAIGTKASSTNTATDSSAKTSNTKSSDPGNGRILNQVKAILAGGVESLGELRALMLLMDEYPDAFDNGLIDKITEEITGFVKDQAAQISDPDELQEFFQSISNLTTQLHNDTALNVISEVLNDPEVTQIVAQKLGGEGTLNQLLTSSVSGISSSEGTSSTGSSGQGGLAFQDTPQGNPGIANGFENPDSADAIGSIPAPNLSGAFNQSIGFDSGSGVNRIGNIGNNDPKRPAPTTNATKTDPNASARPDTANSGNTNTTANQRPDSLTARPVSRPEPNTKTDTGNGNKPKDQPDFKPKPIKIELMAQLKSEKSTATKPIDPNKVIKMGGNRSQNMNRKRDITNTIIAMAAQAHKSKKEIQASAGASAGQMADLLRKPKATHQGLASAFEEDRDGVGEALYFVFMNLAHYRMEEALNDVEF